MTLEYVRRNYGDAVHDHTQDILSTGGRDCGGSNSVRQALKQALHEEHETMLQDTAKIMERHVTSDPE
jgi:hypothetical protein